MIMNYEGKIKVKSSIKPLTRDKRKAPELKEGQTYYVSFGNNNVYPCTLTKIINEYSETEVEIEIPHKRSKKRIRLQNGTITHYGTSSHILYTNEIGATPEDAVKNSV